MMPAAVAPEREDHHCDARRARAWSRDRPHCSCHGATKHIPSALARRGIVIRGASFADLWEPVCALLAISAVLIAASARAFKKTVS